MKGLADGIENSRGMIRSAVEDVAGDMTVRPDVTGQAVLTAAASERSGRDSLRLTALLGEYLPYLPKLADMKVVTDTGALVGELAPRMDVQLGTIALRQRRQ